jgi:hypothetical protein
VSDPAADTCAQRRHAVWAVAGGSSAIRHRESVGQARQERTDTHTEGSGPDDRSDMHHSDGSRGRRLRAPLRLRPRSSPETCTGLLDRLLGRLMRSLGLGDVLHAAAVLNLCRCRRRRRGHVRQGLGVGYWRCAGTASLPLGGAVQLPGGSLKSFAGSLGSRG